MTSNVSTRMIAVFVAALTLSLLTACGGGLTKQTLDPQLKEARTLNSELRAEWTQTEETLNSTLTAVEQFPTIPIDVSKVDMNLVQKALTEAFNAQSKKAHQTVSSVVTDKDALEVGEAAAKAADDCAGDGDSMTALKSYMNQAPDEVSAFITNKIGSVCMIKSNVKDRLPEMAVQIGERYVAARLKLEELKLAADATKTAADANPLMDGAARSAFNSEYDALQTEIKQIEELIASMESSVTNLPNQVRETLEKFTYALSTFGQAQ